MKKASLITGIVVMLMIMVLLVASSVAFAEDWSSRISLPSESEIRSYQSTNRSPYIVCRPLFSNCKGYTEYAVDFRAEYLPNGTYLAICNWDMDLSSLKRSNKSVYRDYSGVAAYAGFQVLGDGRHVAIMSVWDTYCKDNKGNLKTIRAKVTYPDSGKPFDGEGNGVQCIVPYDWQEGRSYRALIQQSESVYGTAKLTFWVCDLALQKWTMLIEYDMNISNSYMTSACVFLENFIISYAADIRTMELWNFRVRNVKTGRWVYGKSASMEQDWDYPGSYNYGANSNRFWAITTAMPNRCKKPGQFKKYSVKSYDTSDPY